MRMISKKQIAFLIIFPIVYILIAVLLLKMSETRPQEYGTIMPVGLCDYPRVNSANPPSGITFLPSESKECKTSRIGQRLYQIWVPKVYTNLSEKWYLQYNSRNNIRYFGYYVGLVFGLFNAVIILVVYKIIRALIKKLRT